MLKKDAATPLFSLCRLFFTALFLLSRFRRLIPGAMQLCFNRSVPSHFHTPKISPPRNRLFDYFFPVPTLRLYSSSSAVLAQQPRYNHFAAAILYQTLWLYDAGLLPLPQRLFRPDFVIMSKPLHPNFTATSMILFSLFCHCRSAPDHLRLPSPVVQAQAP